MYTYIFPETPILFPIGILYRP